MAARKLVLGKQVLRELGGRELARVQGGDNTFPQELTCDSVREPLCAETWFTCNPADCGGGDTVLPTSPDCTDWYPCNPPNTTQGVTCYTC